MLQMTKDQFDQYIEPSRIDQLIQKINPILDYRNELYQRYRRKRVDHQMMNKNGRAIVPFEYYIVNMAKGYLGGKSPVYTVKKGDSTSQDYVSDFKADIDRIKRFNDDSTTYMELIQDYLVTTAAYAYIYEDEYNEIKYVRFDSRNTVGVYDYTVEKNLIGIIRKWEETDRNDRIVLGVEIITDTKRTVYRNDSGSFAVTEEEKLLWGDVPAAAFENPDCISVFEPAITSIDSYEQIVNNINSMTQYNDEAKLILKAYKSRFDPGTPEREKEEKALYSAKTLFVGENGDISWLIKNVDYGGLLDVLKNYHDNITMLTGVPNMTDTAFSNADNASALGYKLYALDQYSATADRVFKEGLLRLWRIITGRLNLKGGNYDFRDIDIAMQRNVPTDKDKSIERAVKMKQSGLYSDETCINESQVDVDPEEEAEKILQQEDMDYNSQLARTQSLIQEDSTDG